MHNIHTWFESSLLLPGDGYERYSHRLIVTIWIHFPQNWHGIHCFAALFKCSQPIYFLSPITLHYRWQLSCTHMDCFCCWHIRCNHFGLKHIMYILLWGVGTYSPPPSPCRVRSSLITQFHKSWYIFPGIGSPTVHKINPVPVTCVYWHQFTQFFIEMERLHLSIRIRLEAKNAFSRQLKVVLKEGSALLLVSSVLILISLLLNRCCRYFL